MEFIKSQLQHKDRLLNVFIYLCLFLFCLYPYRDYDWGWHLKQGEYFFTHWAIYRTDTFSWTMAGYHWINHEWLYDPLLYVLYNLTSFWGLSVAGALVTVATFYFCVKGIKLRAYQLAICAFMFGYLISGVAWQGLRSQMIGLLLIAVSMYLLRLVDKGSKKVFFVFPALYLLWANLHGTFTFGLFIFGLFVFQKIIIDTIKNGKIFIGKRELYLALSFIASCAVTFVNPFGIGVYFEAARHFSNPLLKYIGEWDPVEFPSTFFFLMIIYALLFLYAAIMDYRKTKKVNVYMLGVSLFTFYLAYGARRYVAVAITATLPFLALYFQDLKFKFEKFKATTFLLCLFIIVALEMALFRRVIPWRIFQNYSFADYCSFGSHCSEGLTAYLIQHPPQGKGFNFYDWGGYLIGRGVPAKLFIDGRMHLWKDEKTGYSAFWDYEQMNYLGNTKLFDKYNFPWVLVPSGSYISAFIESKTVKGTWIKKYEDDDAVYWVRTK